MKADKTVTIVNGVVHPDPIAAPATVTKDMLIGITSTAKPSDRGVLKELVLALAAPAAESVTISVYALDEITKPAAGPDAATIFYLIEAAVVVTGQGVPKRVTGMSGLGGTIYLRVTADTLTTERPLRVIQAET